MDARLERKVRVPLLNATTRTGIGAVVVGWAESWARVEVVAGEGEWMQRGGITISQMSKCQQC